MPIYLDNAATTFPKPDAVLDAMEQYAREIGGTAGRSGHARAQAGSRLVIRTRTQVARLVRCPSPERVIFTKNATEALNLAIFGALNPKDRVVCSMADHNSVLRPLRHLEGSLGVRVARVPCDGQGRTDLEQMAREANKGARLVVTTHASNVTGAVQDLEVVAELCRNSGALMCVDAAQTAGLWPIDMGIGIDFVALTGHKALFGPTGTGALVMSERAAEAIPGRLFGGTGSQSEKDEHPQDLPDRFEAGTPNTFGLAGLSAGLAFLEKTGIQHIRTHEKVLRDRLVEALGAIDRLTLFGADGGPATGAISFIDRRLNPSDLAFLLDRKYEIQVRAGLHCAPLLHRSLGTLPAGAVRLSPGYFSTEQEIEAVLRAIHEILAHS